jgi:hypothetical protein
MRLRARPPSRALRAARYRGQPARRLGPTLFLVSAAQFVLQLDFSIVNVALATIQREFGVSAADLQWPAPCWSRCASSGRSKDNSKKRAAPGQR